MKTFLLAGILIIGFMVQSSLAAKVSILGARPDILLMVVVYSGLFMGPVPAAVAGFTAGFVVDLSTTHLLGINALAMSVAGFVAGKTWININQGNYLAQSVVMFLMCAVYDVVYFTLALGGQAHGVIRALAVNGLPSALYTSLISPLFFRIFVGLAGLRLRPGRRL